MAAICAVAPAAISGVGDDAWVRKPSRLRFLFGGKLLYTVNFDALLLEAPFTYATADPTQPPAPPSEFPATVEMMRVHACPLEARVPHITLLPHAIRYVSAAYRHFYVDLSGVSFEDYLRKFRSKSRCGLRRATRRFLENSGNPESFREFRRPEEMREFHRLARMVSRKTYQHRLLDAGMPESDDFAHELAERAARGGIRGYILLHGDTPVAYSLCLSYRDILTFDKTGFDPGFAGHRPGIVLMFLKIRSMFERREFRVFDLGSGDFFYKEFFSTGSLRCADISFLRRSVRNLVCVCAHRGLDAVSEGIKHVLDAVGLKDRIKKLIHHQL